MLEPVAAGEEGRRFGCFGGVPSPCHAVCSIFSSEEGREWVGQPVFLHSWQLFDHLCWGWPGWLEPGSWESG